MAETTPLLVLASGDRKSGEGGSTLRRVVEDTQSGILQASVEVVVCNNPPGTVGVYDKVDEVNQRFGLGLEVVNISGATHPGGPQERGMTLEESEAICHLMSARGIERVLCLGYMKKINGELIEKYGWKPEYAKKYPLEMDIYAARIVNTHPGILPETEDTHGLGASKKAIDDKLTQTAHSLHVVGTGIDTGPIIAEHFVDITPGMSPEELFDEVQDKEKTMIGAALNAYYKSQAEFFAQITKHRP